MASLSVSFCALEYVLTVMSQFMTFLISGKRCGGILSNCDIGILKPCAMKPLSFKLLAIMLMGLLCFSCEKDDDSEPEKEPEKEEPVKIHPDSVKLLEGGYTALQRRAAADSFNRMRAEGCFCKYSGQFEEWFKTDVKLEWDTTLEKAAIRHATDMSKTLRLRHDGSDGSTVRMRVQSGGYSDEFDIAENICYTAAPDIDDAMATWKKSEAGHCQAQMHEGFNIFAISHKKGINGDYYWTLVLGMKK